MTGLGPFENEAADEVLEELTWWVQMPAPATDRRARVASTLRMALRPDTEDLAAVQSAVATACLVALVCGADPPGTSSLLDAWTLHARPLIGADPELCEQLREAASTLLGDVTRRGCPCWEQRYGTQAAQALAALTPFVAALAAGCP
ncbi:MAG: hypothetical protein ACXVYV_09605 [Gaiellales bacterium]